PRYAEDQLATSSLILADLIEKVPTKRIGLGQFVFGGTKVRPAVAESFSKDQRLGIYMQVYNLKADPSGYKPAGTIEYILSRDGQAVMQFSEEAAQMPEASPSQVVVEKMLALNSLEPGRYKLQIKVTDKVTQRSIASSADFMVQ
ncbi:MAG: GWxTD domain-containing protein, partial [Acidobacteria bacterium]|nr:GWxTD domain-containing protein [Acidobacteriota bacterium]